MPLTQRPAGVVHVMVVAKASVPGVTKTRLAAVVGEQRAAELSAAAFEDTLRVCGSVFDVGHRHVALAGDVTEGVEARRITRALEGWTVRPQISGGFAERLVHAHSQIPGPVIQVGTDTPQMTPEDLRTVVGLLDTSDAVLGPAVDGGWWVLALRNPRDAQCLLEVEMSSPTTGEQTLRALAARGLDTALAPELRDVDVADDAEAVAAAAPWTAFAQQWNRQDAAS
ncbi:MAG TPA: DUF2064 domain-containing protein [Aeromicrobium sp.]|nr:DUF2064 domain-containing protein [Aeromicrobium sp.]